MLIVKFDGFFQCRLATDSAPYDSPRGTGGWTFAFGNEPDLDRVIRFDSPMALRSRSPLVEVKVRQVLRGGESSLDHPLLGARVCLLDDPVFEGRNGAIAGDAREPISPMHFLIKSDGMHIGRKSDYDVESAIQRAPYMGGGTSNLPDEDVRGVRLAKPADAKEFRRNRLDTLREELAANPTEEDAEILQARIRELEGPAGGALLATLYLAVPYSHELRDEATIEYGPMTERLNTSVPWPIRYWMGCWDADTLTGFVRGELELPVTT